MGLLETDICGIPLENPFIIASASPSATIDMIEKSFIAGWAGVVTKTVKPDNMHIEDARPRFNVVKDGKNIIGFENFELVSKKNIGYWTNGIKYLKEKYPSKVVITSIMGDSSEESWSQLAIDMEVAGSDALELNFSCPHGMPEMGVGAAVGQNPEIIEKITKWVKGSVSIPVIVKLTPNVTSIEQAADAGIRGGADAFAAINTVESLSGINLETFEPLPSVNGMSTYGGLSGKAVKPIGLRAVSQIARSQEVPIMGIGGISNWSDAMEYMAVGASSVQVCTEVMLKGFDIVKDMITETEKFLDRKGFTSVRQVIGQAIPKLTSHESLVKNAPLIAEVDTVKCIGCGKCVVACNDGGYGAVILVEKKAVISKSECDGCSLCTHVCPTDALELVKIGA
ncbi:MAG: NAD-dependent dihydropyrimidine dehydrogenase subunit PreA [Spirochaetales bacterium]|nr:NAD-dependent dihydropyrimidine dehydrogenase subunit PreA [Spirochaetales bacterium]